MPITIRPSVRQPRLLLTNDDTRPHRLNFLPEFLTKSPNSAVAAALREKIRNRKEDTKRRKRVNHIFLLIVSIFCNKSFKI